MNDKLFVDVTNLNVLYMMDGKFVLGANYSSCLDRLLIDAQALGSSFNVYLCLWPRLEGEGDVVIKGLSFGQSQFWALRSEIKALFSVFKAIPGVNTVYLCNALSGFVLHTRVENFQVVLRYGQRLLKIDAQGREPQELQVFSTQRELFETLGEDFSCYGDLDLVDVDDIRAKYPELSKFMRTTLVPLTSLIGCEQTVYKMSMEEAEAQIARYIPDWMAAEEPEPEPVEEVPEVVEEPVQEVRKPRERIDWLTAAMIAGICVCMFIAGYGYQFRGVEHTAQTYMNSVAPYQEEISFQNSIQVIYEQGPDRATVLADILAYAKSSELEVTIASMSGFTDNVVLQFNCNSTEVRDQFAYYLERKYTVAGINQYGSVNNTDGSVTYEYGATLLV